MSTSIDALYAQGMLSFHSKLCHWYATELQDRLQMNYNCNIYSHPWQDGKSCNYLHTNRPGQIGRMISAFFIWSTRPNCCFPKENNKKYQRTTICEKWQPLIKHSMLFRVSKKNRNRRRNSDVCLNVMNERGCKLNGYGPNSILIFIKIFQKSQFLTWISLKSIQTTSCRSSE